MTDRDWLAPCVALTLFCGVLGLALMPDRTGVLPALAILPAWMMVAAILAGFYGFVAMAAARVASPIAHSCAFCMREWRKLALWSLAIFLAGLNMMTFMWLKPLLNRFVPFWADPLLAEIDALLLLGHDPWTLLEWANTTPAALFYHRGWFALMLLALLAVLTAPPSPQKSALMVTYFMLWSVVGPLIHILLPAAGPVFYAQLGYGDRFAGLANVTETRELVSYLWLTYQNRGFGPGSGISAMPSLHIATTAWMIAAVAVCARRFLLPTSIAGGAIFLLSISLGWHYAVDGIVGAGAAIFCYRALRTCYAGSFGWGAKEAFAKLTLNGGIDQALLCAGFPIAAAPATEL